MRVDKLRHWRVLPLVAETTADLVPVGYSDTTAEKIAHRDTVRVGERLTHTISGTFEQDDTTLKPLPPLTTNSVENLQEGVSEEDEREPSIRRDPIQTGVDPDPGLFLDPDEGITTPREDTPEDNTTTETTRVLAAPTPNACTIERTPGNDILRGTSGRDVICGGGGDDVIYGLKGNDLLRDGPGEDLLSGGAGNDTLTGQGANDRLIGGPGKNSLKR